MIVQILRIWLPLAEDVISCHKSGELCSSHLFKPRQLLRYSLLHSNVFMYISFLHTDLILVRPVEVIPSHVLVYETFNLMS